MLAVFFDYKNFVVSNLIFAFPYIMAYARRRLSARKEQAPPLHTILFSQLNPNGTRCVYYRYPPQKILSATMAVAPISGASERNADFLTVIIP